MSSDSLAQPGKACAMARDPQTIFIYWDKNCIGADKLSGAVGANVRAIIGWALKVKCMQEKDEYSVSIDPQSGSHYLCGLHPGWTYDIRLCQIDTMGDYHTFSRCGSITLSDVGFSDTQDPHYPVTPEELVNMLGTEGITMLGSSDYIPLF